MMEGNEKKGDLESQENHEDHENHEIQERQEIFSKAIRAGKRTYFFDVKSTKRNDYYLTITESKKRFNKDGRYYFEKHKVFLYREDFDKFMEGLNEVIEFIRNSNVQPADSPEPVEETVANDYTHVEFEDLKET
jgi:hypothetical protein